MFIRSYWHSSIIYHSRYARLWLYSCDISEYTLAMDPISRTQLIAQIKDLAQRLHPQTEPFLYYFPALLAKPEFSSISAEKALEFMKLGITHEQPPLIKNALAVLNKIVNHEDGSLIKPEPIFFYNNHSFMWNELSTHTDAVAVISHILNKSLFQISLGK